MFKGTQNLAFKTEIPQAKVFEIIEEELRILGSVNVSNVGMIQINSSKFNGFAYETNIEGLINVKEDRYTIQLDYESKLNTVGWLILICLFWLYGLGLLVLIFPGMAKGEIAKKIKSKFFHLGAEFK